MALWKSLYLEMCSKLTQSQCTITVRARFEPELYCVPETTYLRSFIGFLKSERIYHHPDHLLTIWSYQVQPVSVVLELWGACVFGNHSITDLQSHTKSPVLFCDFFWGFLGLGLRGT